VGRLGPVPQRDRRHGQGARFQVDVVPADGDGLPDAAAGGEHHADDVWQVAAQRLLVLRELLPQEPHLLVGEGFDFLLLRGYAGDLPDRVGGDDVESGSEAEHPGQDGSAPSGGLLAVLLHHRLEEPVQGGRGRLSDHQAADPRFDLAPDGLRVPLFGVVGPV
jgi:hypothetical protein